MRFLRENEIFCRPICTNNIQGFVLWSKGVPPGYLTEKALFDNHTLSISYANGGLAEAHDKFVDVMVINPERQLLSSEEK